MMTGESTLAWLPATVLIHYLIYSTLTICAVLLANQHHCFPTALARVRVWKLAMFLPFCLATLSLFIPAPWLPTIQYQRETMSSGSMRTVGAYADNDTLMADLSPMVSATVMADGRAIDGTQNAGSDHRVDRTTLRTEQLVEAFLVVWVVGASIGLILLLRDILRLRSMIRASESVRDPRLRMQMQALQRRMHLSRSVSLLESSSVSSPCAIGWVTASIVLPKAWMDQLSIPCQDAVLAHELSHVGRRDGVWNLMTRVLRCVGWLQPLNGIASVRLRQEMEFVADQQAARVLGDPASLARCLVQLAERFLSRTNYVGSQLPSLSPGMSVHASGLKVRVSAILNLPSRASEPRAAGRLVGYTLALCFILLMGVPRFGPPVSENLRHMGETSDMRAVMRKLGMAVGLVASTAMVPTEVLNAQESQRAESQKASDGGAETSDGLPEGLQRFNGMLIGTMKRRDIERGTFTVKVDYVARVWENSKASRPRSVVGKEVRVNGVSGKWLDELLLVRPGETVEFEAQHRGGGELTFPGEWLKKVPAFDPRDYPVPPEGFRGFSGMVRGKVIKKNPTSREVHLRIDAIEDAFGKNRASKANEVIGKQIVLAGFWARMSKAFENFEQGDSIRAGVLHRVPQSDHFTVIELAEKVANSEVENAPRTTSEKGASTEFPAGMRGFRGILRGTVVSRDVEKGTLRFKADRATRVWKQSRAKDTDRARGHQFLVKGISGKWVDVLITLKPGDTIEVEAFHNSGDHLDFIEEWLKKVD